MNNKLIFSSLKRFEVFYKNRKFDFDFVEEELISNISVNQDGNRILVFPKDNDYLIIVNLIYGILKYSFEGIFKDGEDILDLIEIGDLVEYNKSLGRFNGVVDDRIVLEFRDGRIRIPLKWRYKISKYNGTATVLNKMPTQSNVGTKKTKSLLSQIFDIEEDELFKTSNKSILFVANKDRIFKIIKDLQLKIGSNERVNISEVFPIGYYRSAENCYYFKGNSKKEEPLIKFTSKVYVAKELVKKIKSINCVGVLTNKIYVDDFSDLKYILKRKNVKSIITFVNPIDIERLMNNDYINNEFKISEIDINNREFITSSELKERQYSYLKNYWNSEIKYIDISENAVSKLRRMLNNECKKLLELFRDDNEILKFIVSARRLCKRLTTLAIPIKEYESIVCYVNNDESIRAMQNKILKDLTIIKSRDLHKDLKNSIDKIYTCLEDIYIEVYKYNSKWKKLDELIRYKRNEKVSIIIENTFVRKITKMYIKQRYPNKFNISIHDGNNRSELYDEIIILGLLNENLLSNYDRYNALNKCILGYRFEKKFYEICRKKFSNYLNKNLESIYNEYILDEDIKLNVMDEVNDEEANYELELENEINSLITTNHLPGINQGENSSYSVKCEKVISFTDARKAFLTTQYKSYVLKENTEELQIKSVRQLNIGEILLFVEGIEKDLVEKVIQGLMQLKEVKEAYSTDYELSKVWKKELKCYMDDNNLNYNDLKERLSQFDVNRDKATLRTWIVDGIVGPQEEEVFEAIAMVTDSEFLKKNTFEIYSACNNVRSFQIKVRKLIAKFIVNGKKLEDLDQIDKLIVSNLDKEINYINKVQIEKIYDIRKEVPNNLVNKVLEE